MYELIQVGEKSYYIDCPAKIGIYRQTETEVYLIDSGNDKDAGKKVRRILEERGWVLKGIMNTHSHADHVGGNAYLQQQTGCKVFASGIEAAFTEDPILEPTTLYAGYPCKDLRHKFLMAVGSKTVDFTDEDFPKEVEVIQLPGHSFHMVGFRTPDGTVFLGDCIASESTLNKYQISFIYNVEEYLKTLDLVENMEGKMFVPSHVQPAADVRELVRLNRAKVYEITETIMEFLKEPMRTEDLLKKVFDTYGLMMNFEQYVLVGSTVRSYLSWLKDQGKITAEFKENYLYWKTV